MLAAQENDLHRALLYVEGASWAHLMIRLQAESSGIQIPLLTAEHSTAYMHGKIEELRRRRGTTIDEDILQRAERMYSAEPELRRAFEEITRYVPYPNRVYGGAVDVYFPIQRVLIAQKLATDLPSQ